MITNCKNCGLPIFHGAAGYVGAQCRCGFSAKPSYDNNALADLLKERDRLKAENWQLKEEAKWATEVTGELVNERDQQATRIAELEDVLRSLACSLGAGGYNASSVDPKVFEEKIRWGIDALTAPLIAAMGEKHE